MKTWMRTPTCAACLRCEATSSAWRRQAWPARRSNACAGMASKPSAECWPRPAASTRIAARSSAWVYYAPPPDAVMRIMRVRPATRSVFFCLMHGLRAAVEHGAGGARQQAARGFPAVFEVALPRLRQTLARGGTMREACIDALFALMAQVADTNVLHRGGGQGAALVKRQARRFLAQGGTAHAQWQQTALDCHRIFMRHRLSPGGAADLLAAAWFVHRATQPA